MAGDFCTGLFVFPESRTTHRASIRKLRLSTWRPSKTPNKKVFARTARRSSQKMSSKYCATHLPFQLSVSLPPAPHQRRPRAHSPQLHHHLHLPHRKMSLPCTRLRAVPNTNLTRRSYLDGTLATRESAKSPQSRRRVASPTTQTADRRRLLRRGSKGNKAGVLGNDVAP
jgi:hypothetical protein